MVNVVKFDVFTSLEKGRGIRATERIQPGEEIINEKPIVCTLTNSKCRGSRCDYCFAESEKLLRCSKCRFVSYCGRNCQAEDWPLHKRECKCLAKVAPKQPPDICRLVSHLLFKYYWGKDSGDNDSSDIENLTSNRELITNSRKEAFFTFGAVLYEYLQGCPMKIEDTDIYGLLCRISSNSFTITNSEFNSIGVGVYKTASFLNHSCDPNVIALFNGPNISIRSIKDIAPEEELLVSYCSLLSPADVRQHELREGYMFKCACTVCSGLQFSDFLMKSIKCGSCSCYQSLAECSDVNGEKRVCSCDKSCLPGKDHLKIGTSCMDELDALYNSVKVVPLPEQQAKLKRLITRGEQYLGPSNISLVRCYEVTMDGCLENEDWKGALDYSKKLVKPYQLYLSKFHPLLGIHYFKQGKLELQIDNVRDGITCLQKAMNILRISHGENHDLVGMLEGILVEATREMIERENYKAIERVYKDEE